MTWPYVLSLMVGLWPSGDARPTIRTRPSWSIRLANEVAASKGRRIRGTPDRRW